jgi:regulatory protein
MSESNLYKVALSRAMALCSKSEYCAEDIRTKLHSWGLGDADIESMIRTLTKENFLNETRFCNIYVREKFMFNKWGRIKIAAQLRQKKISSELIRSALDSVDNEQYMLTLKDLLSEHRKHIKAKNQFDLKGKLMRYGLSKGFESSLLYDMLNDFE